MDSTRWIRTVGVAVATLAMLAGCGSTETTHPTGSAPATPDASPGVAPASFALPQGSEPVELDTSLFAGVALDHPYWPMAPGSRWVYRETDTDGAEQQVEVTVTGETKEILGIPATVVHDIVSADGETIEDTLDWYALDTLGNLWLRGAGRGCRRGHITRRARRGAVRILRPRPRDA